jgi:PAS domain-containing protein
VWLVDDPLAALVRQLGKLQPESKIILFRCTDDGHLRDVVHTLEGDLSHRWEGLPGLAVIGRLTRRQFRSRPAAYRVDTKNKLARDVALDWGRLRGALRDRFGLWHLMGTVLWMDQGELIYCGFLRAKAEGEYRRSEVARLDAVLPVLTEGLAATETWRQLRGQPLDVATVLDVFHEPAYVLTPRGVPVFANRSARETYSQPPAWLSAVVGSSLEVHAKVLARCTDLEVSGRKYILVIPEGHWAHSLGDDPEADPLAVLPPSLLRVAQLMLAGLSDKQIAHQTGLTLPTVRTYVARIYERLEISGRRELFGLVLARLRQAP